MDNYFTYFVWQFINDCSEKTLKSFYTTFFPDKTGANVYNITDDVPFKFRILEIILKNDVDNEILMSHIKSLYELYSGYNLYAKKSVITEEKYTDSANTLQSGALPKESFDKFIYEIWKLIKRKKAYYILSGNKLVIKNFNKTEPFTLKDYTLLENRKCLYIRKNNAYHYIPKVTKTVLFKPKEYKRALTIYKRLIEALNDKNNIVRFNACNWCNPIIKTKAKCYKCSVLYNAYEDLKQVFPELPNSLNQIIKRTQKKYAQEPQEVIKNKIRIKLRVFTEKVQKEIKLNNNQSYALKCFKNAITASFS